MVTLIVSLITLSLVTMAGVAIIRRLTCVTPEDSITVTVDRNNFVKRVLSAGRHTLYPFEKAAFTVEIRAKLTANRAADIAASDGLLVTINWSGVYSLRPDLITEAVSQRLRSLPHAERAITRHVDIVLRQLLGHYPAQDLFKPAIRERLERQLSQVVADRLRGLGIVLNSLNLQAIELPVEVTEALNKAKALEALDGAIRQLDPATRDVVRGVYQLDEILHWDAYLPKPSRLTMKRLAAVAG